MDWPERLAQRIEDGASLAAILVAVLGNARSPAANSNALSHPPPAVWLHIALLSYLAVVQLLLAAAKAAGGGFFMSEWTVPEQATRWLAPVRWLLAQYHRPAYTAVKEPGDDLRFWVPLFEKHNLDLVCEADGHVIKRTVPIRAGKQDPTGVATSAKVAWALNSGRPSRTVGTFNRQAWPSQATTCK